MTKYMMEFIAISGFILATLGFNDNAIIALALYYLRKLVLYFVGTQLAREVN
jgi:hypothetical protein